MHFFGLKVGGVIRPSVLILAARPKIRHLGVGIVLDGGRIVKHVFSGNIEPIHSIGSRWVFLGFLSFHILPHELVPQEWDGRYFAKKPFKEHFKRFRLQLGHMSGFICPARSYVVEDFVVIDVNGIHQINLHFCGCPGAPSHSNQLIEFGWWPSTPKNPQTAATQNVLRNFLAHNYRGQITPTDYYKGLEELTCAKGLTDLPVCFVQLAITCSSSHDTSLLGSSQSVDDNDSKMATL